MVGELTSLWLSRGAGVVALSSYVGPLDGFAGLYRSFALQRLRGAYSGPLAEVRRNSDNATMLVYPLSNGWADYAAVLSWAGSDSVYIQNWYDQEGSGEVATQSTGSAQFRVVNSGVPDLGTNGHLISVPDGVNDGYLLSNALGFARNASALTMAAVTGTSPTTGTQAIFSAPINSSNAGRAAMYASSGAMVASARSVDGSGEQTASRAIGPGTRFVARNNYASGTLDISVNGATTAGTISPAQASPDNDSFSAPRIGMTAAGALPLGVPLGAVILARSALDVATLDGALQLMQP